MEDNQQYTGRRRMGPGSKQAQDAHESGLVPIRQEPFNAESPLVALNEFHTTNPLFYVRSNFPLPQEAAGWNLTVGGAVERQISLTLDDLKALPRREIDVTLECAGNDRTGYTPKAEGEQWGSGAISTGRWAGAVLRDVLNRAGLRGSAVEVLFEGADSGQPHGQPMLISFARSLPLEKALHPDTMLAYELNGEPLPQAHGGPVRLLVSGWYGMASVKWLTRISAIEEPFAGYYQVERYVLDRPGQDERVPVREMFVKSLITSPAPGEKIAAGTNLICGVAWSGSAPISAVEVSVDANPWQPARLLDPPQPYAWRRWKLDWRAEAGHHILRARATDQAGNTQAESAEWNRLGYCNNAIQEIEVEVE